MSKCSKDSVLLPSNKRALDAAGGLSRLPESLLDEVPEDVQAKIDIILASAKIKPSKIFSHEEKRKIITGFALGWRSIDIRKELNAERGLKGLDPITYTDTASFGSLGVTYKTQVDAIHELMLTEITRVWRFADKFIRVGELDLLAQKMLSLIKGTKTVDNEYRKNLSSFLTIIRLIAQEMGTTKIVIQKTDINISDNRIDHGSTEQQSISNMPLNEAISEFAKLRYGDRTGRIEQGSIEQSSIEQGSIEDVPFEEIAPQDKV